MKITRFLAAFICLAILICSLSSCDSFSAKDNKVVLTVGDYEVTRDLYYYITENLKRDLPDADREEIDREAFDMLCEIYAVFALAEDFGIADDDKYIASQVDEAVALKIEECGSKAKYKKALEENHMTDNVYRFLEKHSRTADEVLSAIFQSGKYPSDEDGILALCMSDEFVCVKQILVKSKNSKATGEDAYFISGEEHTDEEALAIAEKARGKAEKGADFDSLVAQYGEAFYMFNNTNGYYVCRGMWEQENEDAVFALGEGEISPVIKSDIGYSVFLRCEKSESYVRSRIDDIAESYYQAQYNLLLEKQIGELSVETTEAFDTIEEK